MSAHPTVSIVIVCMNRLDNLYPCLRGIEKCCSGEFETLVVEESGGVAAAEDAVAAGGEMKAVAFMRKVGGRGVLLCLER